MKYVLTAFLIILLTTGASAQTGEEVARYTGSGSKDSAYGLKLDTISTMQVELILRNDSTYTINWHLNFNTFCRFDTLWSNTGKWFSNKGILYFTLDEDPFEKENGYFESAIGIKDYPIINMSQDDYGIGLSKEEYVRVRKTIHKHPNYEYYLKVIDDTIAFRATWDCVDEV